MSNTVLTPRKVVGGRYGGNGKKQSASESTPTSASAKLPYASYHRPKRKEEPLKESHLPWMREPQFREIRVDLAAIGGLALAAQKQGKEFHAELYRKFLGVAERYAGKNGTVLVMVIGYATFPRNKQAGEFKKVRMVNDTCALPAQFLEHAKEIARK